MQHLSQIAARQNLAMNAGGNMVFMGGGICAGKNYEERAAYDISERVSNSSTKMSGIGTLVVTPSSPTPAVRSSLSRP